MKRTSIIIALTAVLTLTAQEAAGQVKSSLDLCLKDEATGEWLIGLFNDYAIYDCEYWNYAAAEKGCYVLSREGQQIEVRLKKNTITIDGVKHKTSVLTSKYLPDYPVKDETAFDSRWLDSEQEATLRVIHSSGKAGIRVMTNAYHPVKNDVLDYTGVSDSLGRYEALLKLSGQTGEYVFTDATMKIRRMDSSIYIPYVLSPGDKLLLFVDDMKECIYAMGKTARLTNEFLNHPMYGYSMDYDELQQMDFTTFIGKHNVVERRLLQQRDSILSAAPMLSKRYRDYTDGMRMALFAHDLGQMRFNRGKVTREQIIREVQRDGLLNIDVPYLIMWPYHGFLDDVCDVAIQEYCMIGSGVPFLKEVLQKARDGRLSLSEEETLLIEHELPAEAAIQTPIPEQLDSLGIWMGGFYLTDTLYTLFNPETRPEVYREIPIYYLKKEIAAIDSLRLPPQLREIAIARKMMGKISHDVKPMEDYQLQILRENVHQPYLLGEVLRFNDQLIAARKASESIVTPDPRPLADLTEGEDIFNKIVEPYRGRYIYLDVWGTWCAPCKAMMKHVPQMKEQLKDLDIVYLYLCSRSDEESWKTAIAQFHLTGDNCIHYNLPDNQQSALERYIGVGGYPTYKLVMPTGKLLPSEAPRPDHPEAIRHMIEETKNDK